MKQFKEFAPLVLLIVCIFIFLLLLPYFAISFQWYPDNFLQTGQIGDTIGGITGPVIACIAAILTFAAFWIQYKANEQQKEDLQIERFENKFFELLKIQREIASDIGIGKHIKGGKSFIKFFYEFRFIYTCVKEAIEIAKVWPSDEIKSENYDTEDEQLKVAFTIFFMGIGPNSDALVKDILRNPIADPINDAIIKHLKSKLPKRKISKSPQNECTPSSKSLWPKKLSCWYYDENRIKQELTYTASYKPFQGHQGKLGHYYRHLYRIVKFVDEADEKIIPFDKKYEYVRFLRTQLSTYEQILLYYNSFASSGKVWIDKEYIVKYKLIRNLPIPLLRFSKSPEDHFDVGIKKYWKTKENFFEWHSRMAT